MDFEIWPCDAYTGGVFKSCIKWRKCKETSKRPDFLAARMAGIVRMDRKEIRFLESEPVELSMKEDSETVYRCIIPRDALPSMKLRSLEVVYTIIVEVYYGVTREVRTKMFSVHPFGFKPLKKMENIIVHSDMIRVGNTDDTAFGEIVDFLRNKAGQDYGTTEEMVGRKMHFLEDFPRFMREVVERYKLESKGDIYFYVSMEGSEVEEDRYKVTVQDDEEEVATVEYGKLLVKEDTMMIWYKRNSKKTRIILEVTEFISGEVSNGEERLLKEFNSDMCLYKAVPLRVEHDCFTFDCKLFSVKFSYRIELDNLVFVLPISKASPRASLSIGGECR